MTHLDDRRGTASQATRWRLYAGIKRVVDCALVCLAAPIAVPLGVLTAAVVRVGLGRPILFRQERPGRWERPFTVLKFRTMRDAVDGRGRALADRDRLTRVGRFLRRASLDELPQLVNVLKGDMSLVGPRPLLMRYLPYFTERERARFLARPGITGLAQVSGRNQAPWSERLAKDAEYVEHWSIGLDVTILARTVLAVAFARGALADESDAAGDLDVERGAVAQRRPDAAAQSVQKGAREPA